MATPAGLSRDGGGAAAVVLALARDEQDLAVLSPVVGERADDEVLHYKSFYSFPLNFNFYC